MNLWTEMRCWTCPPLFVTRLVSSKKISSPVQATRGIVFIDIHNAEVFADVWSSNLLLMTISMTIQTGVEDVENAYENIVSRNGGPEIRACTAAEIGEDGIKETS